jgi:hypothetical protein
MTETSLSERSVEIPLFNGRGIAIVDAADYELVSSYRWTLRKSRKTGYAAHRWTEDGKKRYLFMHQLITGINGIDHANRNGLDNRRENLRVASRSQQSANRGMLSSNTSGYIGVHRLKNKPGWTAEVKQHGKRVWRRSFADAETAARVRDSVARKAHGEFAVYNFTVTRDSLVLTA